MFTFNSPVIHENIWNICLKTKKELNEIYYEGIKREKEEDFCDLTSVAAPLICKTADELVLRFKERSY